MVKHDENKDLRLVSRVAKINYSDKSIQAPKSANIGIRTWGRIDYLVNYCGWMFIYNNEVKVANIPFTGDVDNLKPRKRDSKRTTKENTLTNKRNKKQ